MMSRCARRSLHARGHRHLSLIRRLERDVDGLCMGFCVAAISLAQRDTSKHWVTWDWGALFLYLYEEDGLGGTERDITDLLHNYRKSLDMGLHFGELAKIRGLISYRLSPHEQRAYAGAISNGIPNIFRRFRESVFRVAPPFIIGYLIYEGVEREHHRLSRKNPADFENDQ